MGWVWEATGPWSGPGPSPQSPSRPGVQAPCRPQPTAHLKPPLHPHPLCEHRLKGHHRQHWGLLLGGRGLDQVGGGWAGSDAGAGGSGAGANRTRSLSNCRGAGALKSVSPATFPNTPSSPQTNKQSGSRPCPPPGRSPPRSRPPRRRPRRCPPRPPGGPRRCRRQPRSRAASGAWPEEEGGVIGGMVVNAHAPRAGAQTAGGLTTAQFGAFVGDGGGGFASKRSLLQPSKACQPQNLSLATPPPPPPPTPIHPSPPHLSLPVPLHVRGIDRRLQGDVQRQARGGGGAVRHLLGCGGGKVVWKRVFWA